MLATSMLNANHSIARRRFVWPARYERPYTAAIAENAKTGTKKNAESASIATWSCPYGTSHARTSASARVGSKSTRSAANVPTAPPETAPRTASADDTRGLRVATSAAIAPQTSSASASASERHVSSRALTSGARCDAALSTRSASSMICGAVRAARDRVLEPRVVQRGREAREQVEVRAHRRRDEQEDGRHRLAVDRAEVDRLLEEAERDRRMRHGQHDGVSHVRDRDALADAGRAERLARDQRNRRASCGRPRRSAICRRPREAPTRDRCLGLCDGCRPASSDAARARQDAVVVTIELRWGHADPARRRPLEQLGAMEPVVVADAVRRDASLADPPVDLLFRNVEHLRGVADGEVHEST